MDAVVSPPGDQRNVPPANEGVAVNVAGEPLHTLAEFTDKVGAEVTVTVEVPEPIHPFNV